MKIALSIRVDINEEYDEPRNSISFDWMNLLFALDILPILIPNCRNAPNIFFDSLDFDGLILTGGDDIRLTPKDVSSETYNKPLLARDTTEYLLLKKAIQKQLPIIGVCRGFQLINLFFGGFLTNNLNQMQDIKANHVRSEHEIVIIDKDIIELVGKNNFIVNSYHNQGVFLKDLAHPLKPFAVTSDGIIVEGFFHKELPILGIMWHPEREDPLKEETRLIIDKFLRRLV